MTLITCLVPVSLLTDKAPQLLSQLELTLTSIASCFPLYLYRGFTYGNNYEEEPRAM